MIGLRRFKRRKSIVWAVALLLGIVTLSVSLWLLGSPPPRKIRLATGDPAGGFAMLGRQYKTRLDRLGLRVELVESHGALDNLHRLQAGKVDVAFVQAGTVQLLDAPEGLCGLAAVGADPLWIFSRTLPHVASLRDLKGHTVVLGPSVSGTDALSRLLLQEHGVTQENTTFMNLSMGESRQALVDGKADTVLIVSAANAPVIKELIHQPGVRLVRLSCQAAIARHIPYLRQVILSEGTLDLEHDLPQEDTPLLAPVTTLVARDDLHPRVVEQLLMAAQAVHSSGSWVDDPRRFPSLEGIDLPAHPAAEKYTKSGESFLARLLPYWSVRLVWEAQLVLLPILALLLPFWKTFPLLYNWRINRILKRHYTALREVEIRIDHCAVPAELLKLLGVLDGLRTDMETLSRKLPAHLQRDVYHWRQHVALVRSEGLDRLRRLEGQSTTPVEGNDPAS